MKNLKKWLIPIFILGFLTSGVFLTGCKKDKHTSEMEIEMTDAPAAYAQVNVDIERVEIHILRQEGKSDDDLADAGEWITLNTRAGIYNLLDLQNGVTIVLADRQEIPAGYVTQMRLILGADNTLKLDNGDVVDLKVASGMQTGVKIVFSTYMEPDSYEKVLVDFDASQSVVANSDGSFNLKPVIKVIG